MIVLMGILVIGQGEWFKLKEERLDFMSGGSFSQ